MKQALDEYKKIKNVPLQQSVKDEDIVLTQADITRLSNSLKSGVINVPPGLNREQTRLYIINAVAEIEKNKK